MSVLLSQSRVPKRTRYSGSSLSSLVKESLVTEEEVKTNYLDIQMDGDDKYFIAYTGSVIPRCGSTDPNDDPYTTNIWNTSYLLSSAPVLDDRFAGDARSSTEIRERRLDINLMIGVIFDPGPISSVLRTPSLMRILIVRENINNRTVANYATYPSLDSVLQHYPNLGGESAAEYFRQRMYAPKNIRNRKVYTFLYDQIHQIDANATDNADGSFIGFKGEKFVSISLNLDRVTDAQVSPYGAVPVGQAAKTFKGQYLASGAIFVYAVASYPWQTDISVPVRMFVRGSSSFHFQDT